ncbi:hypothetical protein COP2_041718 [Malus domestica]
MFDQLKKYCPSDDVGDFMNDRRSGESEEDFRHRTFIKLCRHRLSCRNVFSQHEAESYVRRRRVNKSIEHPEFSSIKIPDVGGGGATQTTSRGGEGAQGSTTQRGQGTGHGTSHSLVGSTFATVPLRDFHKINKKYLYHV